MIKNEQLQEWRWKLEEKKSNKSLKDKIEEEKKNKSRKGLKITIKWKTIIFDIKPNGNGWNFFKNPRQTKTNKQDDHNWNKK